MPLLVSAFFRRYYVTDIWKDDAFRGSDRSYRDYWLSKLQIELAAVSTRRVIFVGRQAERGKKFVAAPTPVHYVPFPGQWAATFDADVINVINEIRATAR